MKIRILFLLAICVIKVNGQTYKSFIYSGVTKWLYFTESDACGMGANATFGDTIINQLVYKKVWNTIDYYFPPETDITKINQFWLENNELTLREYDYFLRQSNDSSKLYFYDKKKNIEYLISDMNLKAGDEFTYPGLETDIVDTVYYENGLKTIKFKGYRQQITNDKMKFMEGIGPNLNFLLIPRDWIYSAAHILICYSNPTFFYHHPHFNCGCVTKNNQLNSGRIQIEKQYNHIFIRFNESELMSCELYDVYGRKVFDSGCVNVQQVQIPWSNLSSGIYFIRIFISGDSKYISMKIAI